MESVSVIIPSHNRAHCLSRCLASVLAQTRAADEIIVINDGSSDGTEALIAREYPETRLISQEHKGVSAARNAGIRESRGNWLAFLDSDDTWFPNKLERQLQEVESAPGKNLVHTNELWVRNGVRINQKRKHRKYGGWIFRHCLPVCIISPSSVMIHRRVFDQVGPFDETMPVCEDYDLWLRICARMPVAFIDEPLITKYGGHADQLSGRYRGMDRYRIAAIDRVLNQAQLGDADRQAAIDMLVCKTRIYLDGAKKHGNTVFVPECEKLLARYQQCSTSCVH